MSLRLPHYKLIYIYNIYTYGKSWRDNDNVG
jgi:hypothetical protein